MAYNYGEKIAVMDREAELHNSRINSMYSILSNASSDELEALWEEAKHAKASAAVIAPEKPAEAPVYGHTPVQSDLFTAETLDRTLERTAEVYAPAMPQQTVSAEQAEVAAKFSLTHAAKKAIVIFASVTTVMLAAISVNTQWINNREAKIAALEANNASARIELATLQAENEYNASEEAIREWAVGAGLIEE